MNEWPIIIDQLPVTPAKKQRDVPLLRIPHNKRDSPPAVSGCLRDGGQERAEQKTRNYQLPLTN
jgi:hypothetical protein